MNGAALVAIAATIGNFLQGWDNATIAGNCSVLMFHVPFRFYGLNILYICFFFILIATLKFMSRSLTVLVLILFCFLWNLHMKGVISLLSILSLLFFFRYEEGEIN